MRISDWSSDVCSSDLSRGGARMNRSRPRDSAPLSPSIDPTGRAPLDAGLYSDAARAGDLLRDPSLYFNRELSQLDFNFRVLAQAVDAQVPLLERRWEGRRVGKEGVSTGMTWGS